MRTVTVTCVLLSGLVLAGCNNVTAEGLLGAAAQGLVKGLEAQTEI